MAGRHYLTWLVQTVDHGTRDYESVTAKPQKGQEKTLYAVKAHGHYIVWTAVSKIIINFVVIGCK